MRPVSDGWNEITELYIIVLLKLISLWKIKLDNSDSNKKCKKCKDCERGNLSELLSTDCFPLTTQESGIPQ